MNGFQTFSGVYCSQSVSEFQYSVSSSADDHVILGLTGGVPTIL